MTYQAIQSFSADFEDGRPTQAVHKGEVFPDGHELVLRDADTSDGRVPWQLFARLEQHEQARGAAAPRPRQ